MKRPLAIAGLLALAVGMVVTARTPEAGAAWRVAFVVFSVAGALGAIAAIRVLRPSGRMLVLVAVALRVVALPLAPTLSDDGYRYIWDGAVQLDGRSPYADTPREQVSDGFRPPVPLAELNSPDYHSVYPPVSQMGFVVSAWIGQGSFERAWWAWKLLLVVVDVLGIAALARLVAPEAVAVYAWHPVSVMEIAGQGHTEGLALGLIALGLIAVSRQRPGLAGGVLALAGWVKLWPFALLGIRPRVATLAVGALVAFLVAAPYALAGEGGALDSLSLYAGTFDFYSAPFLALKAVLWPLAGDGSSRVVSVGLGLSILAAYAVIAYRSKRSQPGTLNHHVAGVILLVTLLSPTLHPWHLLPALFAISLVERSRVAAPVVWLVSFAPVTYLVYTGPDWTYPVAVASGWGGAMVALAYSYRDCMLKTLLRTRGARKWARLRPHVPPEARILDYGAAEGFVGLAASSDGHSVLLADLEDARAVDLPFVRAHTSSIPLGEDAVDVVLLVFVLHHAASPEAVLREASRVSRGPLLVWETVPSRWMPASVLEPIDGLVNRQRPGEGAMPPARLRSIDAWEETFEALGLRASHVQQWGVVHPQALWVLERA